jgi:hypothetical protein
VNRLNGSCLCGAIKYGCDAEPLQVTICHCPHCQKQTGTSFSVLVAVLKDSVKVEGQTLKIFDDVGESGLPVRRQFCGNCGSPIMTRVEAMPDVVFIKAGTLEDTSKLNPTMEMWCETAQSWIKWDKSRRALSNRNPAVS